MLTYCLTYKQTEQSNNNPITGRSISNVYFYVPRIWDPPYFSPVSGWWKTMKQKAGTIINGDGKSLEILPLLW